MMPKLRIREWLDRCPLGRIARVLAVAGILLLTGTLLSLLLVPVRMNTADMAVPEARPETLTAIPAAPADPPDVLSTTYVVRSNLFRSSRSLQDKPMADKTIERIRSQLRLQCILQIDGEPIAYVNVKNMGIKKCRVGESVADLFTVLNIYPKSIEISIVDHRVTLSL